MVFQLARFILIPNVLSLITVKLTLFEDHGAKNYLEATGISSKKEKDPYWRICTQGVQLLRYAQHSSLDGLVSMN